MNTEKYQKAVDEYVADPTRTLTQIARKHNVHRYTLSNLLREQGIDVRSRYASKADIEAAVNEYNPDLLNLSAVCKKYGISPNTLRPILKERGIDISNRRYKFDTRYFREIDTEEKAYWLGFFCADGHIARGGKQITFCLARRDKKHLERFAAIFGLQVDNTQQFDSRTQKTYLGCRLVVSSVEVVQDILAKGVPQAKTSDLDEKVFDYISEPLLRHFVRGYFDGDGCIYNRYKNEYAVVFAGTDRFLEALSEKMSRTCDIGSRSPREDAGVSRLEIGGNHQVVRMREWLYADASVFLERKRKRFEKVRAGHQGKSSSVKNVSWCKTRQKWVVRKMVNGKYTWGGAFDNEKDAIEKAERLC